jgi:hypothetical protein
MQVAVPKLPRAGDSPVAATRPITVELPSRELNRRRVHELNAIEMLHMRRSSPRLGKDLVEAEL